jgi:hypothetical protein
MTVFLTLNLLILGLQASTFICVFLEVKSRYDGENLLNEKIWIIMIAASIGFFLLSVIMFFVTFCRDPGYTKSIKINKFNEFLDKALSEDRNLDYFCFFCRCIWS